MIGAACTTNTLSKNGGKLCAVCVNCETSAVTPHVMGNFDSVFTNSDPVNCPIISCVARYACDIYSGTMGSVVTVGGAATNYRVTYNPGGCSPGNGCLHCKTANQNIFYSMGMTSNWGTCSGTCKLSAKTITNKNKNVDTTYTTSSPLQIYTYSAFAKAPVEPVTSCSMLDSDCSTPKASTNMFLVDDGGITGANFRKLKIKLSGHHCITQMH